ncbi:MAG: recombinase family protein [Caldimonas sp.]
MAAQSAAQYIRMSTDKQDLSPSVQKEAIAAYAAARGMEIVASYEDEGRSGVHLKNRPGLMKLLRDVTESRQFSTVLVYDVSRWGRFQDTDAAAYHEYHCRLHGAEVVYVAEMFGAEVNPITAMLKGMKRAMTAEYSRDLSKKSRAGQHLVIARGYQMGQLPPLGFRRCSVSGWAAASSSRERAAKGWLHRSRRMGAGLSRRSRHRAAHPRPVRPDPSKLHRHRQAGEHRGLAQLQRSALEQEGHRHSRQKRGVDRQLCVGTQEAFEEHRHVRTLSSRRLPATSDR